MRSIASCFRPCWLPTRRGRTTAPRLPGAVMQRATTPTSSTLPADATPRPSSATSLRADKGRASGASPSRRRCHAPRRRSPTEKVLVPHRPAGCAGGRDRAPRRSRCLLGSPSSKGHPRPHPGAHRDFVMTGPARIQLPARSAASPGSSRSSRQISAYSPNLGYRSQLPPRSPCQRRSPTSCVRRRRFSMRTEPSSLNAN